MHIFYRLLLTLNSTLLIGVIFLIKEQEQIGFLTNYHRWVSYILFILIPVFLTGISLLLSRFLSSDSIEGTIKDVAQGNNAFLPSYLGYFFVAISIPRYETLIFVFLILFVFTYLSQTSYFNPLFLLWGYQFYYLTTENNVKIFLISKKTIRRTKGLSFPNLKRINDFTYIDKGDG
ncbi:MAG TPA: hypothetical protein DDZ91_11820 [Firmicutes bacterium]|nr:hypothetical protein [Bacillota bacterium]